MTMDIYKALCYDSEYREFDRDNLRVTVRVQGTRTVVNALVVDG